MPEREPKRPRLVDFTQGLHLPREIQATCARLRETQNPYTPGDVLVYFDEEGKGRYCRVRKLRIRENQLTVDLCNQTAFDPRGYDESTIDCTPTELDRFSRGIRSDLAILLKKVQEDLFQTTTMLDSDAMQFVLNLLEFSGDERRKKLSTYGGPVGVLQEFFWQGAQKFYYGSSPNYQALLTSLEAIIQWNRQRMAERVTELSEVEQITARRKRFLELAGIDPNTAAPHAIQKYGGRIDHATRAGLCLLQLWEEAAGRRVPENSS